MGDLEEFKAEGFVMYDETKGICLVSFMDENTEIPYNAKCFINPKGTIGYAEVDIKDKHEFVFLSKTAKGDVITMTGDQPGPLPIQAPGYFAIFGVPQEAPVELYFVTHKKALGEEAPIADENWLKVETPRLPQRTLDIAMVAMGQVLEALGGPDGLMKNMADAMAGAMEGIGKGLEEAFKGDGQVEVKNDWDKPPEEPEPTEGEPKEAPVKKPKAKPKAKPAKKPKPKPKAKPAKKAKAKPKSKKKK